MVSRLLGRGNPERNATGLIPDAAIQTADEDRLSLDAVAATLGGLVSEADTPANIAVFGAWGSGKTSLAQLLRARLRDNDRVKFVYFNAWKYSETPLRRHFLAGAGKALGEKDSYANRLYAKRRTTKYKFGIRTVWVLLALALTTLGVAVILMAAAQFLAWLPNQTQSYWSLVSASVAANAGAILISASLLAPVLTFVVNEMKVELSEDEPSSAEQFDVIFRKLISKHLPANGRIVFFIDELDRAPARQMQAVLETLKTFLENPGCVFVVAADQVVLERSLSQLDEVTVPGRGNPYYSGGSAYLDKVFQYQIHLPAFEGPVLTRFAVELVEGRQGIWMELGADINTVVSLLVPSHVRSPRRVKVVLNNFVLSERVARSRLGGQSLATAQLRQLAKLVCLRTEFPLFYRDVESYPSLVDAVTAHVLGDSERVADYAVSKDLHNLAVAYATGTAQVDVRLGADRPVAEVEDQAATDQLLEYLRRSRDVPIADHSLVFMRSPGTQVGLEPSIARRLDVAARNGDTEAAIEALDGASPDVVDKAVRFLAIAMQDAIGVEIANMTATLLAVSRGFIDKLSDDRAAQILNTVERPEVWARITPEYADALVQLAGRAKADERDRHDSDLVNRAAEGNEWATAILLSFDYFGEVGKDRSRALLASHVSEASSVAADVAQRCPGRDVESLWQSAPLDELANALADPTIAIHPQSLIAATALASRLNSAARWRLLSPALRTGDIDRIADLRAEIDQLEPAVFPAEGEAILAAIAQSPDLAGSLAQLLPKSACAVSPAVLIGALASLVEHAGSTDEAVQLVKATGQDLSGVLEGTEFEVDDVIDSLPPGWDVGWPDAGAASSRIRQHSALVAFANASPKRSRAWTGLVARSILALIPTSPVSEASRNEVDVRIRAWNGLRPPLSLLNAMFDSLSTARLAVAGDMLSESYRRLWLFRVAWLIRDVTQTQREVLRGELPAKGAPGSHAAVCTTIYVTIVAPSVDDEPQAIANAALLAGDKVSGRYAEQYFYDLREPNVLQVLGRIYERGETAPVVLLSWVRANGDQLSWARFFADLLRAATTLSERKRVWTFVAALRLDVPKARSITLQAALETMTDTAGSLDDLLAALPDAFPGWSPDKKTVTRLNKAAAKFSGRILRRKAQNALDKLQGK